MARRYKPLPAGAIVWMRVFDCTAEVISDDGAGLVELLERHRAYDHKSRARRSQIRPATAVEAANHSLAVTHIMDWRRIHSDDARVQLVINALAAAASVTPAPADPAG